MSRSTSCMSTLRPMHRAGGAGSGEGHASRAAAVAVCLDTEKWIIKWVVDPPKGQKAQQMLMGADGPFGEQSVRISTVKEGFLLYHGSVVVQPRPDAIKQAKVEDRAKQNGISQDAQLWRDAGALSAKQASKIKASKLGEENALLDDVLHLHCLAKVE